MFAHHCTCQAAHKDTLVTTHTTTQALQTPDVHTYWTQSIANVFTHALSSARWAVARENWPCRCTTLFRCRMMENAAEQLPSRLSASLTSDWRSASRSPNLAVVGELVGVVVRGDMDNRRSHRPCFAVTLSRAFVTSSNSCTPTHAHAHSSEMAGCSSVL